MRENKHKRYRMTLIMGASAILFACSYNIAYAKDILIYKCTKSDGSIMFQDVICPLDTQVEVSRLEMNQSADSPAVTLRQHEQNQLARLHEKHMQQQELNTHIKVAQINAQQKPKADLHKTEVHVHQAPPAYYSNQNNNSFSVIYKKVRK